MVQHNLKQSKELELLKRLVGEWAVGIAMKTSDNKVAAGCGTMTAKEVASGFGISAELDMHIEGYDDYFEHDLWSFDRGSGKVHLFSVTSQGDVHDHVGNWQDDKNLSVKWLGNYEGEEASEEILLTWLSKDEIRIYEIDSTNRQAAVSSDYVINEKLGQNNPSNTRISSL